MHSLKLAAALLGFAIVAMPANAQSSRVNPSIPFTAGDATHIMPQYEPASPPDSVSMPPVERARYTLNSYASCLVHANRKAVETTLSIPGGTKASDIAERKLSIDSCLGVGELSMDGSLLRGALYRALYRADYARSIPDLWSEHIDYAADLGTGVNPAQYVALHQFAECVVRADPVNVRGVLVSSTASAAERDYLSQLSPIFSSCLTTGSQVKLSKSTLVGLLAEVMFRLSNKYVAPIRSR